MADEMTTTPPAEERDADPAEMREVNTLWKEYETARKFDEEARKQYAIDRSYAGGKAGDNWAVNANLLGNYIDILVAYLYARDPDVSARPAETVRQAAGQDMQDFAQTMELVVSRLWSRPRNRLKRTIRKQTRSGLTVGVGWMKAVILSETRTDPQVQVALNDARDNLARLQAQMRESQESDAGHTPEEIEANLREMERQVASLESNLEVELRKGMAIDFVKAENIQVSLDVDSIEDYLDASWVSNDIYKPKDEVAGLFPRLTEQEIKGATCYYQRKPVASDHRDTNLKSEDAAQFTKSGGQDDSVEFVRIVELWDRRDNHIKTMIDGVKRWAKEPFLPNYATSRFYPFFLIMLYPVDGQRHPDSLAARLRKLQDEYASTRSNGRLTRSRSIPGIIFNSEQIDPENARKLEGSVHNEFTGLKTLNPNVPFRDLFAEKPVPRVDPALFDTRPVERDMEKLSGVQEALQQSVTTDKTATEAQIQQSGFATRTTSDRDVIESMLDEFALYTAELSLQCLGDEEVRRMAGKHALWPEIEIDDLLTMVEIEIEGGSTGKPNTTAERESWATALPLIRETMVLIQQAQLQGNLPLAKALIELLRETLRRLDDRVNVERFIPELPASLPAPGGATPPENGGGTETDMDISSPGGAPGAGAPETPQAPR